jgi:hypothetical protein
MLNSHPAVTCYGALFLPEGRGRQPAGGQMPYFYDLMEQRKVSRVLYPLRGWQYAKAIFNRAPDSSATGFKLMYSQFRYVPWLLAYLAIHRVRVIHLIRRNRLDHVISIESARARGRYHQRPGDTVENPPISLDPVDIVERLRWEDTKTRRASRILRAMQILVYEVSYESLARDRSHYADVLDFLNVNPDVDQLTTSLQKWNQRSYRSSIANYDEIEVSLAQTPYAAWLDESAGD